MVTITLKRAEEDFDLYGLSVHIGDYYGMLNDNDGNNFHCFVKPYNNEFASDEGDDTILNVLILDGNGWSNHWLKENTLTIRVCDYKKLPQTFIEKMSTPHFLGGFSAPAKEVLKKMCGKGLYNKNFATGTIVVKA